MGASPPPSLPPLQRRIFANRTLNLRAIQAVGFDMDYTLIHYRAEAWERSAFSHLKRRLSERGWPVDDLQFDPGFVTLGLVLDLEQGNIVKANRFGYVKRACHGTRMLPFDRQKELYARELVDLGNPRWVFLNTLFSLSSACMLAQLIDRLDAGRLEGVAGYPELYREIQSALDETHADGLLKGEISEHPDRFVVLDEELPAALVDLRQAGKKLLLITNSEWHYTRAMMAYAFDLYLPGGDTWRDLFDLVVVGARKPAFFTGDQPFFEVVDEQGNLQPVVGGLRDGGTYLGGCAGQVERHLGLPGEQILYVGDHVYADVHVTKSLLRWRTALVVRQLEGEIAAVDSFRPKQAELARMMADKEIIEHERAVLRLALQRSQAGRAPPAGTSRKRAERRLQELRERIVTLDEAIAPLARAWGELNNPRWGLLMRAGNDKSNLARQIERYADVYTSRVSNLLYATPFGFLRSPHQSMPHDPGQPGQGEQT